MPAPAAPPPRAAPAAGARDAPGAAGGAKREPAAQYERLAGDEQQAPPPPQPQRRDVRAAQRALEGAEEPLEWRDFQDGRGYGRGHGADEDEDDEFFLDDEGDFGGTVAIVALCMLLACVPLSLTLLSACCAPS